MSHTAHHQTHRASESGDYSRLRHGPDRLTKWAVGTFLTIMVAIVMGLGGWAFTVIYGTADTALGNSNHNREEIGLVKKDVEYIKEDVKELKSGQKTIMDGQQTILDTLYQRPSQRNIAEKPILASPAPLPAEDPNQP